MNDIRGWKNLATWNQMGGGELCWEKKVTQGAKEAMIWILLLLCNRQDMMLHNAPGLSLLTMCSKGHSVFKYSVCDVSACVRMLRFAVRSLWLSSVCGVDESSPRRAGRTGCHRLQVCAHRGKETILLPGGQTVLCYQTAHQLPLQGDLFTFFYHYTHLHLNLFS